MLSLSLLLRVCARPASGGAGPRREGGAGGFVLVCEEGLGGRINGGFRLFLRLVLGRREKGGQRDI